MKKFVLALAILLAGCAITDSFKEVNVDNENCIGVRRFKVIQANYLNTALAYECYTSDCSDYYNNILDFIYEGMTGNDLYDGMIYEVPSDKCAVRRGVYKYETKSGDMKTVSQIFFEYKNNYKSEEEHQERIYKAKEEMYKTCLYIFEDEKIKKDEEYCFCYGNSYIDNVGNAEAIKKECGKLPKFLPSK